MPSGQCPLDHIGDRRNSPKSIGIGNPIDSIRLALAANPRRNVGLEIRDTWASHSALQGLAGLGAAAGCPSTVPDLVLCDDDFERE